MAFVTPNGKEIKVYKVEGTALYKIAFATGGELPDELKGKFTHPKLAEETIQEYISRLEKKSNKKAA